MVRLLVASLACGLALGACSEAPTAAPTAVSTPADRNVIAVESGSVPGTSAPAGPTPGPEPTREPEPTRATSDLLVTGNTSWGRYIDHRADGDTRWPFSGLAGFDRPAYDTWVSTLECPAVESDDSLRVQEELLRFHCDPAYLTEAARWFDVFSLADNHTDNQGTAGLAATRRNLDRAGIAWFGDPDPEVLDQVCEPIAVRVHTDRGPGWLPVAFCGYHGVFAVPSQDSIDQITRWSDRVPVIAMPHSGLEYVAEPDSIKTDLYRAFIDAGADVVLGDHAHWVQTSEAYRGRLIVYGMGNFMFDQQGDEEKRRSAAIHVRLTGTGPDLGGWLTVGRACAERPDSCATLIRHSGLPELDVRLEFAVVGTTNPGMLTVPASAVQTAAIRERLRWSQTMAALRSPQGPLSD